MTYRALKRVLAKTETYLVPPLARIYRPFLSRTRFIAITGSCGKTTAKELIADILQTQAETHRNFDSNNRFFTIARTLLELRPRHRNCVVELGASGPGSLAKSVALLAPQIAVVTSIGSDHYKAFRGVKAAAAEKRRLIAALRADGIAVLNKDDPLVMAMANDCRGRVLSYGLDETSDIRGEIVEYRWPDNLSLDVHYRGNVSRVETKLLGAHLATPLLASIATAIACGVSISEAAVAVANTEPVFGRMSSETTTDGVTFIHDHFKAPFWTLDTVLSYLASARATQKVLVVGTISDYAGSASSKYRRLARHALEVVDHVVFASREAPQYFRKILMEFPDRLHVAADVHEAATLVAEFVVPDTLVFLKGSVRADHLERVAMHYRSSIACWRQSCGREIFCRDCEFRNIPYVSDAEATGKTSIAI